VERVLGKLGLHSRAQLAAWAVQNGHTPANICPTPDAVPEP
jgi:hypothetical protein